MKQLQLPNSSKSTSQLGFGCAFWDSVTERDAARILDAAYDAGIRYFDVAPFYLNGAAEAYVGKFVARHSDVSIASKYGLLPYSAQNLQSRVLRKFASGVLRVSSAGDGMPGHRRLSALAKGKANYSPDKVRLSLSRSLSLLNKQYLDIFLFHEPDADDLADPELIELVQSVRGQGIVGAVGIGGLAGQAPELFNKRRSFCDVMQYDWNALHGSLLFPHAFQIVYWVLGRDFRATLQRLQANDELIRDCSEQIGLDLRQPNIVRALLLKCALRANQDGIVLFYSSSAQHIKENVRIAEDASLDASAEKFLSIVLAPTAA